MSRATFYAEHIADDVAERVALEKSRNRWRALSMVFGTFTAIGCATTATMATLHEFVPVMVNVDSRTGSADVHVGKVRIDAADPKNELMLTADLVRHTRAREGFTLAEAENNYLLVYLTSAPSLRGAWDDQYRADRNPKALVATLHARDQIRLDNIAVSFLPSLMPNARVAQVRYDKVTHIGSGEPVTQRFVSTMTVTYDPKAVPSTVEGIAVNFAGFQVLNYRADKETEEVRVAPPATAPTGVFPSGVAAASAGGAK